MKFIVKAVNTKYSGGRLVHYVDTESKESGYFIPTISISDPNF